jgi:hypothetical protein
VVQARARQLQRAGCINARLDQSQTNAVCLLAPDDQAMLENAIDLLQLSARSMHRILRVARTIADLAGSADILGPHVAEAIGYRRGERAVAARATEVHLTVFSPLPQLEKGHTAPLFCHVPQTAPIAAMIEIRLIPSFAS